MSANHRTESRVLVGCALWLGLALAPLPAAEATPDGVITTLSDGRLLIAGQIAVDRHARTVSLPAVVNQHRGLVEYLLVHTTGKRHEALFATIVRPQHLHAACLLAGAGDAPCPVTLHITWQGHGPAVRLTPEHLLLAATHDAEPLADAVLPPTRWSYGGSRFTAECFAADQHGSCIALQADPLALMQATDWTGDFIPHSARLPPIGSPVSLILTFAAQPAAVPSAIQGHS